MSAVQVDMHIPIEPGGYVKLKIEARDVAAMADRDREFILAIIDRLAAWTPPGGDDRQFAESLPAVLRGVGGRP